jgi:hypothetical protein
MFKIRNASLILWNLRSTIVIFVLTFAVFGLLLGYSASYDARSENVLELTTDKPEYDRGEVVTFTAKNVGSETLVFPDPALGMRIKNLEAGDSFGIIAAQVLTPIEAGESREISWQDAPAGNYTATINTAGGSSPVGAEAMFRIN